MIVKFGKGDTSFRAAGGVEGINTLVERFYAIMNERPQAAAIRAMHPLDLTQSIDKLSRFLCGWLGGPRLYQQKYGSISIPLVHAHLQIGETEKQAWLDCMKAAIDEQDYPAEFADYLITQLAVPAERVVQICKRDTIKHG